VGFAVVYLLLIYRVRRGEYLEKIPHLIFDFLLYAFIAALLGGRIGYVLFYNFSYFWAHPKAIISPYDVSSGQYVGLYGMNYHSAVIGVVLAIWYFCKKNTISFWRWTDFIAPAIPPAYFFGSVGNFLNGELYGRITTSPLGMYFAQDPSVLRHPSQLYEAFAEGMVLFAILWMLRNKSFRSGSLAMIYVIGYGIVRFAAEFFRQPDPQIGLLLGYLTLGQLLCAVMVITGAIFLIGTKSAKVVQ